MKHAGRNSIAAVIGAWLMAMVPTKQICAQETGLIRHVQIDPREGTWMSVDVSADGKHIVFVSDRDGADNVCVMNVNESNLDQITFGRDMHTSPTWSPDGRFIAVRRVTARPNAFVGSAGELFVYPAGSERIVKRGIEMSSVLGFSSTHYPGTDSARMEGSRSPHTAGRSIASLLLTARQPKFRFT